jgi:hypothetical protein
MPLPLKSPAFLSAAFSAHPALPCVLPGLNWSISCSGYWSIDELKQHDRRRDDPPVLETRIQNAANKMFHKFLFSTELSSQAVDNAQNR